MPDTSNENYYFCSITEMECGYEFTSNFLMTCAQDEDESERFDGICLSYRGEDGGERQWDGTIDFGDGIIITEGNFKPIPALDFHVMRQYLAVL